MDWVRAAVQAIHEAYGEPATRCAYVNSVLRQYPDADPSAVDSLLAGHDAGECDCAASPTSTS